MAQVEDAGSTSCEGLLKRKAISEIRLQDPKLWSKILWIRKNFAEDDNSGVRKVDFYNFVTEHLGRTGYRDVWHLLKMAYPHVERIRRGRKYMYWGIRHVDELEPLSCNENEDDLKDACGDDDYKKATENVSENKENNSLEVQPGDECSTNHHQSNRCQATKEDGRHTENSVSRKQSPIENENGAVVVKSEHVSDEEDADPTKGEEVVVMEFKEKDVFESFEDYEKSRSLEEADKNIGSRKIVSRSASPPVEIFSENRISPDLPPNSTKGEEENHLHGNDQSKSAGQETVFSSFDEQLVDKDDSRISDPFAPNLLEPENINRVCIPLIHDARKRSTRKTTRSSRGSDTERNEDCGGSTGSSTAATTWSSSTNHNTSVTSSSPAVSVSSNLLRSPLDAVIVSVATMQEPTNHKETRGTTTTHLPSSNEMTSSSGQPTSVDNGSLLSSQSEPSPQVVVVQDRGIQVCERAQDTNQRSKRTIQQCSSTDSNRRLAAQDQIVSINPLAPNVHESSGRKKLKLHGSAVNQNIYQNPSLRVLPNYKSVDQRPKVRSPSATILRVPGVAAAKPELPSAKVSRAMTSRIFHTGTPSQGSTVVGDRVTAPHQRAIIFAPPSASVNGIGSTTERLPNAPSLNTANPSMSSPPRNEIATGKTVFYPISASLKQNQVINSKRSGEIPLKPNATLETRELIPDERSTNSDETLSNRDTIRKLLEEHETKTRSTSFSSQSDLQVMVDCLSSELEKERSMRLRLEVELRKAEKQLEQERKLNEKLAALLMKR